MVKSKAGHATNQNAAPSRGSFSSTHLGHLQKSIKKCINKEYFYTNII